MCAEVYAAKEISLNSTPDQKPSESQTSFQNIDSCVSDDLKVKVRYAVCPACAWGEMKKKSSYSDVLDSCDILLKWSGVQRLTVFVFPFAECHSRFALEEFPQ